MERTGFLGANGFVWWIGVVENRKDPLNTGRCQVRMIGWHTENKLEIPTADLPWAHPILPVNGSRTFTTPKEGDRVVGFFMDGEGAQFPVIMGVLPGIPEEKPNTSKGFSDPRSEEELKTAPNVPKKVEYKTDGSGVEITNQPAENYPNKLNEPTTARMCRNEKVEETPFNDSRENTEKKVPVAKYNDVNPKGLSSSIKLTTGFDLLSGVSGVFSSLSSIIPTDILGKIGVTLPNLNLNIPSVLSSKLSEVVPSNVGSKLINSASNVGVLSSTLTELGASNFNSLDISNIEKLAKLPSISSFNFSKMVDDEPGSDIEKLKSELKSSNIDLSSFSDKSILNSMKTSGVDVKAIESTFSLNNITDTSFLNVESFTKGLNDLGIGTITNGKQSSATQWSEPKSKYNAQYPYNMITETESGHLMELDDTPGKERINLRHRSGTFSEMHPNGDKVTKVVKDKYSVTLGHDHVKINGDCKVTINSNCSVYIVKDCTLSVDGNLNTTVKGDWNLNVGGSVNWNINKNFTSVLLGDYTSSIKGKSSQVIDKSLIIAAGEDFSQSSSKKITIAASSDLYLISKEVVKVDAPTIGSNMFSD